MEEQISNKCSRNISENQEKVSSLKKRLFAVSWWSLIAAIFRPTANFLLNMLFCTLWELVWGTYFHTSDVEWIWDTQVSV